MMVRAVLRQSRWQQCRRYLYTSNSSWSTGHISSFRSCRVKAPSYCAHPIYVDALSSHRGRFSTVAQIRSWWEPPASEQPPNLDSGDMNIDMLPNDSSEELLTRRIHILGTGSIGTLVAHALAILPNPPPINLLLHRQELYYDFTRKERTLRLANKNNDVVDEQHGFDVDILQPPDDTGSSIWKHVPHCDDPARKIPRHSLTANQVTDSNEVYIYTLIVTVKGPATVNALKSVKHRIDSRTTILLMQNGMGQIDLLNNQVFTDPEKRPTYMLGIISHGCYMQGPFSVVHAGFGSVALGIYRDTDKYPLPPQGSEKLPADQQDTENKAMHPTDADLYSNLSSRYLLRTLTRSPVLACAAYPYLDLLQLQLEKLVANALINPLTALLDVQNGNMRDSLPLSRIQRLLIAEISIVIRNLPELDGIPNVKTRFAPSRLEDFVTGMIDKTAKNSSSMREDVRHVKETEIDFINGYIVKRGEEQGIKCVLNYMIIQLIKAKSDLLFKGAIPTVPANLSTPVATSTDDAITIEEVEGRTAQADALATPDGFVPFVR